jgi:hypothetical protein
MKMHHGSLWAGGRFRVQRASSGAEHVPQLLLQRKDSCMLPVTDGNKCVTCNGDVCPLWLVNDPHPYRAA